MAADPPVIQRRQQGHSRSYIIDRLKRENRTDFVDAIERGELSAYAVGVQMGWFTRPPSVAAVTHQARKRQLRLQAIADDGLTLTQIQELRLGVCGAESVFSSREELEDAWQRARERLMAPLAPGRRPQAFYEFEFTGPRPPYDTERSVLWRMGLLTADEKATLEAEWKMEFERGAGPDFTLNDGSGEILGGDCARAAHYAWADIPRELVKRWEKAARRRRGRRSASSEEVAAAK
jgi:hypothetical protein